MTDTFFTDHPEVVRYILKHARRIAVNEQPSIPLLPPGRIIISVWNGRAAVSRYERYKPDSDNEIIVVEASNWQDLEAEAEAEAYEQGGALNLSGHYACSPHLATHAVWSEEKGVPMTNITALPDQLLVEPVMDNWIDDTDPEYDFRKGYAIKHKDAEGWHEIHYGSSESAFAWLQERGYEQLTCTMRRHRLAGRYEQKGESH